MPAITVVVIIQVLFLLYFILLGIVYLALNVLAAPTAWRYMKERSLDKLPRVYAGFEPPISVLAPAFNEEATISATIRSLLQLSYPDYEVLVINDGSTDRTMDVLINEFNLVPFPEAYRVRLKTRSVRNLYASLTHANLRVLDKENGGKSDALNAGLNAARNPLYCCVDADSILQRDSLIRIARPFIEDPTCVACGGTVRVANGCDVRGGFLSSAGIPGHPLALLQIIEYLRAFLFGRLGWAPLNAVLIISGAFGLLHKETVIEAGGYRPDTVGEDMELVVRLHRMLSRRRQPYKIKFIPDPICWTEVPEDLNTLRNQRIRWQRGLGDALWQNRGLFFAPRSGAVGWLALPFMLFFEFLGPMVEIFGYCYMTLSLFLGLITLKGAMIFLLVAIGLGTLLSASALLLEELSFHLYPRLRYVLVLLLVSIVENLGYRQLISFWRLVGVLRWLRGGKAQWGKMTRKGDWTGEHPIEPVQASF